MKYYHLVIIIFRVDYCLDFRSRAPGNDKSEEYVGMTVRGDAVRWKHSDKPESST